MSEANELVNMHLSVIQKCILKFFGGRILGAETHFLTPLWGKEKSCWNQKTFSAKSVCIAHVTIENWIPFFDSRGWDLYLDKSLCRPIFLKRSDPNHHLLSEKDDFSRIEPSLDIRPVCKFEFVYCGLCSWFVGADSLAPLPFWQQESRTPHTET